MDNVNLVLWLLLFAFVVGSIVINVRRKKYTLKTAITVVIVGMGLTSMLVSLSFSEPRLLRSFEAEQIELKIDSESVVLDAEEIFKDRTGVFTYRVKIFDRLGYMVKEPYATVTFIQEDKSILEAKIFAFDTSHEGSNYLNDKPVKIYWRGQWIVYDDSFYINLNDALKE